MVDQGGIPGDKTPTYVAVGYWLLEFVAIGVAIAFFGHRRPGGVWTLAFGVGAGPLIGKIRPLCAGPGCRAKRDDRGNWSEPLGVISLVAEGLLVVVVLAGATLTRPRPRP